MATKKRINAIADAAAAALLGKGKGKAQKPYFLARGVHTDKLTGEVIKTVINGIRPDRVSPAAKRALLAPPTVFHTIPRAGELRVPTNPRRGGPHMQVRTDIGRSPVVFSLDAKNKSRRDQHGKGNTLTMFGAPVPTGHQRRLMRRYRAQNPTMDTKQLMEKIIADMVTRLKKVEARAAA